MRNHLTRSVENATRKAPSDPRRMTRLGLLLACCIVMVVSAKTAVADAPPPEKSEKTVAVPEGVAYIPDVPYCIFDDKTMLEMDIAYPSRGAGPFPALVILHGQGWVMGSRKIMTPYLLMAAKAGYVGVAVSYRFAPEHPFPAAVQDSKCAVRWLRANANTYKIDKDHIGAFGFSAGGNLACMLGTTDGKEFKVSGGNANLSDRVQAVVSFYGMIDLPELDRCRKEMPPIESLMISYSLTNYLGGNREKCADRYAKSSPINYVTKDTAPTFLVHGTKDKLVPIAQSQSYAKKLKESGVETSLREVKDEGHDFVGEAEKQALKETLEFLDKRLKPASPVGVADQK